MSRDGINVNVLIPAPVETEMLEEVTFEMVALQSSDVVDAVLFLDSLHPRVVIPQIAMHANLRNPHCRPPARRPPRTEKPSDRTVRGAPGVGLAEWTAGIGLVIVGRDGSEESLSWGELEAGANQWCRGLQS